MTNNNNDITHAEWEDIGLANNWIGPLVCITHDGLPTSEEEDGDLYEDDACIWIHRAYEDADHKAAVEANHSPSVWRKPVT